MILVNLGCGKRFHHSWVNYDFVSTSPNVIQADLRLGIPLQDARVEAVYHSHVLEHFSPYDAHSFLAECYRILKPGGVLRVVVPDLEQIARAYLGSLDAVRVDGSAENRRRHMWMIAEIVDQSARHHSGGEFPGLLSRWPDEDFCYVYQRWGEEARQMLSVIKAPARKTAPATFLHNAIAYFKTMLLKLFFGSDLESLRVGKFRRSGEPHLWMYDFSSLSDLLICTGFVSVTRCTSADSRIANWRSFTLDESGDGQSYKPDSLYIEAIRPPDSAL